MASLGGDGGGGPGARGRSDVRLLAMHGAGLSASAGGIAHQVRNPLNAIVLQLALLADKIGAHRELAEECASQLAKLRDQVGRVDEVVRRFVEVADPSPGAGMDAARLLGDVAVLFAHEARHRHLALEVAAAPPGLRVRGAPDQLVRLWTGLVWRAVEEASPAGGLRIAAAPEEALVALRLEYGRDPAAAGIPWIGPAVAEAARAAGGTLEEREGESALVVLRLPAEGR